MAPDRSHDRPRAQFAAIAAAPDREIDLPEAALWIAAEEYPALDVAAYLGRLEGLAEAAAARLRGARSEEERVEGLNRFLFEEQSFRGNRADYYDPRNSFLNDVLDRRAGIPITLSLVWLALARALGLDARGIGFPGHFLVKATGPPEILVDPFEGRTLSLADCAARLAAAGAGTAPDPRPHLRAASPREILARLLGNLKLIYAGRGDVERTLACCDRILLLQPDAPHELRDRGLLYAQLDYRAAALADLERYLELAPADEDADAARTRCAALRAGFQVH